MKLQVNGESQQWGKWKWTTKGLQSSISTKLTSDRWTSWSANRKIAHVTNHQMESPASWANEAHHQWIKRMKANGSHHQEETTLTNTVLRQQKPCKRMIIETRSPKGHWAVQSNKQRLAGGTPSFETIGAPLAFASSSKRNNVNSNSILKESLES